MLDKLTTWLHGHIPTRDQLERNRFVRPFAHRLLRSDLWRFNRRSVPRGVALGLFVGVMIPLAHFVVAAFLAVFIRANIPAALAATFIGFPVIYVGIVALAYKIGELLLNVDKLTAVQPISETMQHTQTDKLLTQLTHKGLDTAVGLLVIATVLAIVGYFGTSIVWRWWIGRKRRRRLARIPDGVPL
ncbi:MAG: DUF2062 domain-containing protein [Novosphingobium sp.]|nr:DUF2062 domain-containing protein [Novosphingobium sp.]